jgi:hypothetical protein
VSPARAPLSNPGPLTANGGNRARSSSTLRGLPLDPVLGITAAFIVFVVYVNTMYPGIFESGDPTKFAFVG